MWEIKLYLSGGKELVIFEATDKEFDTLVEFIELKDTGNILRLDRDKQVLFLDRRKIDAMVVDNIKSYVEEVL